MNAVKASLHEVPWKKACQDCVLDHCLDARLGYCESSEVCKSRDVSRFFVQDSGQPALSVACVILSSVRPGKSR